MEAGSSGFPRDALPATGGGRSFLGMTVPEERGGLSLRRGDTQQSAGTLARRLEATNPLAVTSLRLQDGSHRSDCARLLSSAFRRVALGAGAASKAAPALVEVLAAAFLVTGAASRRRCNHARDGGSRYGRGIPRRSGRRDLEASVTGSILIYPISIAVALKHCAANAILPILWKCLALKGAAARNRTAEYFESFHLAKIDRI